MEKRWVTKESSDREIVKNLAEELNIDRNLAELLVQRGITTFEQARAFFSTSLSNLHDPFLMKDMAEAINRIETAIKGNEKILVYGDYDVDGTTAVALMYTFLHKFYDKLDFYIPDRYIEGYGVSFKAIDFAAENKF